MNFSMLTLATPRWIIPKALAALFDKSMTPASPHLSLIKTITDFPVNLSVTFTRLPRGNLLYAAVNLLCEYISPVAVRFPTNESA